MLRECINNPKFHQLKAVARRPLYQVVGMLESLWLLTSLCAPAGDIGRFSDEQIEAWLEWEGEPGALVSILIDRHWVDRVDDARRLIVHDWDDHCPYYLQRRRKRGTLSTPEVTPLFPDNGRPAADNGAPPDAHGQPLDVPPDQTRPDQRLSKDSLHVSSLTALVALWNQIDGVMPCLETTRKRQAAFNARRRTKGWVERLPAALARVEKSQFCHGAGEKAWVADIDWFLRPDTMTRLLEGKYDDRKPKRGQPSRPDGRVYE